MFQLLLLTAPTALPDEPRLLTNLLAQSPGKVHLRKPGWPAARLEALVQALPTRWHSRLVLHGHPVLVRRYQLGGLHLPAALRTAGPPPRLLPGQTLSTSFHSLAEISRHRRRYDYVFLSPIFDSISKAGYASGFDLATVQARLRVVAARPGYRPQVLALGGVSAANIGQLAPAGFAGAAVLGTVWQSPDPAAALRELQAACA